MSSSEYLRSNPLAEHNSGIALSSKDVPITGGSSGNMYPGQGGRAFVQGGGGMSQYHSFDGGNVDNSMYARGSYAPVTVGHNSVTSGGSRRRGRGRGRGRSSSSRRKFIRPGKKCRCILFGGSRHRRRSRKCHVKNCHCICHSKSKTRRVKQRGGNSGGSGFANAAYSIAGSGTGIDKYSSALANPAPHSAYNSCHPVA